jgi:hypothetical protein
MSEVHFFRLRVLDAISNAAGGQRGFDSCRHGGICLREPQATLEKLLEAIAIMPEQSEPADTNRLTLPLNSLISALVQESWSHRTASVDDIILKLSAINDAARDVSTAIRRFGTLDSDTVTQFSSGEIIAVLALARTLALSILDPK